jgi:hypothetical protein
MTLQNTLLNKFWLPSVAITTTCQNNKDLIRNREETVVAIPEVPLQTKLLNLHILSILLARDHILVISR